jgi:hypothetical protein
MNDTVSGVIDHMIDYATISERMGYAVSDQGISVSNVIKGFNASTEPQYAVQDCGPELAGFGTCIREVDSFVKSIADQLRAADSNVITVPVGAAAATIALKGASGIERLAGDIALAYLFDNFEKFDRAKPSEKSDGFVSVKDIERIATTSRDPIARASAAWLLEHQQVLAAMNRADSGGNVAYDKIMKSDIERFRKQRAAFQVFNDNFSEFDGAQTRQADGTVKLDGKVSRQDIEKVAKTSKNQQVKDAAEYLLNDQLVLDGNTSSGDNIIGRHEMLKAATQNGEPIVPLKTQTNWVRTIGCTAAGELSVLSYADLLDEGNTASDAFAVGRSKAYSVSFKKLAKETSKVALAKSAKILVSWQVTAAATVVDIACRATAPRADWGLLRDKPKKKDEELNGPPSTPQVMAQK